MKLQRILIAVVCLFFLHRAEAVGTLISAPSRVDMVHDGARDVLYISSGTAVLRYHLGSDTFLSPFNVGASTRGMDLSPDGNTLAVTDTYSAAGSNRIHLIDLPTGIIRQAYFASDFPFEAGTFSVAYGNDSALLITSEFAGSGWTALRRYDPASNVVATIASVRGKSMLCASGDGSIIGLAEDDISSGPVSRYSVSSRTFPQITYANTFLYDIAVNRNGGQLAVPHSGGCFIYELSGANLVMTNLIGLAGRGQPVGAVFHPSRDAVFFAWATTGDVRVYQTVSWTELARFDFQSAFVVTNTAYSNGRMKISRDGSIIFASVTNGIRYFRHNLVIPDYDYDHRLIVNSSPAGLGAPTPPFGTNWVQSTPAPMVTNRIDAVITNGGSRFHCVGWTGTGSVPPSGTINSVTFILTNFSTLTWNFAWDAYVAPPWGTTVAPTPYAAAPGTTGLNTLVRGSGAPRAYQMQFSAAALSGLPIGAQITELRFRQDANATNAFPPTAISWSQYEVTMARASNSVSGMSSTFANNMADPVLVKTGALAIAANQFPAGGTPNAFASFIVFDKPYAYRGGDLVMLFRETGGSSTATTFLDALNSSTPGYGTDFRAYSAPTFAGTFGASASVTIPQIVFNYSPTPTISRSATNVIIVGAGGPPGGGYHLLASTSIALPVAQWTPVTGDVFDNNGAFRYTNSPTPNPPARFLRVALP